MVLHFGGCIHSGLTIFLQRRGHQSYIIICGHNLGAAILNCAWTERCAYAESSARLGHSQWQRFPLSRGESKQSQWFYSDLCHLRRCHQGEQNGAAWICSMLPENVVRWVRLGPGSTSYSPPSQSLGIPAACTHRSCLHFCWSLSDYILKVKYSFLSLKNSLEMKISLSCFWIFIAILIFFFTKVPQFPKGLIQKFKSGSYLGIWVGDRNA